MNAPKLRFKDFNDEWTDKTLNNLVELLGGNAFSSNESVIHGVKWLKIANVSFGNITWDTIDYLPQDFLNKYTKYLLKSGDLVLTLTRPIIRKELKIARLNESDTPALLNQRVAKLVINTNLVNQNFLYQLLRNRKTVLQIESAISGTDPPNLGNKELKKIKVFIPSVNEGYKVGNFIDLIDKKIQKQKEKVELLKEQNKGLKQKIFSQELRFKDENEKAYQEWTYLRLKDLVTPLKGNSIEDVAITIIPVLSISAKKGFVNQKDRFSKVIAGNSLSKYTELQKYDLSYNKGNSKVAKFGCVYMLEDNEKALVPNVYKSFRAKVNVDPLYLQYYFSSKLPDKELKKIISSTARMDGLLNVSDMDFYNIPILTPIKDEQVKISSFLLSLEKKINKEKDKLTLLSDQKNGFMQQLFI